MHSRREPLLIGIGQLADGRIPKRLSFDDERIDTRPFFPPLSSLPAFAAYPTVAGSQDRNPVAYDLASRSINLPSALNLTEDQVERVCATLCTLLRTSTRETA